MEKCRIALAPRRLLSAALGGVVAATFAVSAVVSHSTIAPSSVPGVSDTAAASVGTREANLKTQVAKLPTATPGAPKFAPVVDNRTTEERATAYMQGLQTHMARRAQWIQQFQAMGRDARQLPRSESNARHVSAQPTLTDALREAEMVVEGKLIRVVYTPEGAVGTVQITANRKMSPRAATVMGGQPTEVEVDLGYSPEPEPGYSQNGGTLVYSDNTPVLFQNDRVLLFLQATPNARRFGIQSYTGGYAITANDQVVPTEGNPFRQQLSGRSIGQVGTQITDELRRLGIPAR